MALAWWRRRKPRDDFFDVPATEEEPEFNLGQLKRFSLHQLQVATNNFSNRNILGRGGFGKVYRGRLADGILVAVKRLKPEGTQGGEQMFQTEVEMISMAVHPNILRGTFGHVAPEYLASGRCSEKADIYGYGVMLLELITGQRAFCLARLARDDDLMLLDWVKRLLREKKLETVVDADLKDNYYIDAEVKQLIQVALLCTQEAPLERPKMSEVVRMLEGDDGLTERWEKWQKEEMFTQEFNTAHDPNTDWIIADSTYNLRSDELWGPR